MSEGAKGKTEGKVGNTSSLHWLWGTAVIVAIDQTSKAAVEVALSLHHTVELLPVFNITLVHNSGAAFSFLAEAGGWQRWFFSALAVVVSAGLVVWLYRLRPGAISEALGVTFVLGGALGNLWDRIQLGYVIDFHPTALARLVFSCLQHCRFCYHHWCRITYFGYPVFQWS